MTRSRVSMMSFRGSLSDSVGKNNLVGYLVSYVIFPFAAKYTVSDQKPVPTVSTRSLQHDSERCAAVVVGLGAHCLFQFYAGPYVWCPGPCRKGKTHVGNCTVTLAVSQSNGQLSALCSFVEVPGSGRVLSMASCDTC